MNSDEVSVAYAEMEQIGMDIIRDWANGGKQGNYRGAFERLGPKGQISDIYRKVEKLINNVWDGHKLVGESPEQIASEIIPHCLILIWLIEKERMNTPMLWPPTGATIGTSPDEAIRRNWSIDRWRGTGRILICGHPIMAGNEYILKGGIAYCSPNCANNSSNINAGA